MVFKDAEWTDFPAAKSLRVREARKTVRIGEMSVCNKFPRRGIDILTSFG